MNVITRSITALMMVTLLSALTGCATEPKQLRMNNLGEFLNDVAALEREIYRVFRKQPEDFQLVLHDEPAVFGFYGKKSGEVVEMDCDKTVWFLVEIQGEIEGRIGIGDCTARKTEIDQSLTVVKRYVDATAEGLYRLNPGEEGRDNIFKAGLTYQTFDLPHLELHQFPVIIVGHGMFWAATTVAFVKGRDATYVVQIDTNRVCHESNRREWQLCNDPALGARKLLTRLLSLKER